MQLGAYEKEKSVTGKEPHANSVVTGVILKKQDCDIEKIDF